MERGYFDKASNEINYSIGPLLVRLNSYKKTIEVFNNSSFIIDIRDILPLLKNA